jgi:hypothetical protein
VDTKPTQSPTMQLTVLRARSNVKTLPCVLFGLLLKPSLLLLPGFRLSN